MEPFYRRPVFKKASIVFCAIAFMASVIAFSKNPEPAIPSVSRNKPLVLPNPVQPPGTLSLVTEPDDGMQEVLSLVKNSKQSVDLVMYEFDDTQIADALADAESRGVLVRVLLNKAKSSFRRTSPIEETMRRYLVSKNVPVEYAPDYFSYTHQKTVAVDGNEAFIMTFNFVRKDYAISRDFGILDKDSNDVASIERTFDADWHEQPITSDTGDELLFSPGSETAMVLVIQKATRTLDVYNEEMADDKITSALVAAENRGVRVRVTMTYQTSYKAAFQELAAAGVGIRTYASSSKKKYIHAKAIIADGTSASPYAFVGSQNFSYTSLEKNRELGVFITDPTIVSKLEKVFESDWQGARIFKVAR